MHQKLGFGGYDRVDQDAYSTEFDDVELGACDLDHLRYVQSLVLAFVMTVSRVRHEVLHRGG